jgi:hypothetical protein
MGVIPCLSFCGNMPKTLDEFCALRDKETVIFPESVRILIANLKGVRLLFTAVRRKTDRMPKGEQAQAVWQYLPNLEDEIRECLCDMRHNEMMFNLETEPDLVEQRIYERQALRCRYRYLMNQAKKTGLRSILRNDYAKEV